MNVHTHMYITQTDYTHYNSHTTTLGLSLSISISLYIFNIYYKYIQGDMNALQLACSEGHIAVTKVLCDAGADINAVDGVSVQHVDRF